MSTPGSVRQTGTRFRTFAIWAALAGTAMLLLQGWFTTADVRAVKGLRIETVTVLADPSSGKGGCGRGSSPRDLQLESRNPPAGLPAVFWARDQCHPEVDQGDVIPLAREIEDGKVARYWINPTVTYGDAFWTSLGSGITAFLFVLVVLWIGHVLRGVWLRHFWHD